MRPCLDGEGELLPTSRDMRDGSQCRFKAFGDPGGVHVYARVNRQEGYRDNGNG